MGFFDNIGKGLSDFSQATIQKGKDVANVAKYNRMIAEEEKAISGLFEALGKQYFELHPQDPEEVFKELIGQIVQSRQNIESYTEMIKELQGITKCAQCGSDVPNGALFCPDCGMRIVKKSEEETAEGEVPGKPKKLFCTNCGAVISPGYKFCAACGMKVEPAEQQDVKDVKEEGPGEIVFPDYQAQENPGEGPED